MEMRPDNTAKAEPEYREHSLLVSFIVWHFGRFCAVQGKLMTVYLLNAKAQLNFKLCSLLNVSMQYIYTLYRNNTVL